LDDIKNSYLAARWDREIPQLSKILKIEDRKIFMKRAIEIRGVKTDATSVVPEGLSALYTVLSD